MSSSQPTVIVVDDSDEIRDTLTMMLEADGFRVLPVEDGTTALTMSKHIHPVLITLDMNLPGENGQEVLRKLKRDPETSAIPVLIISGQQSAIDQDAGDAALLKPFDLNEMEVIVRRLVGIPDTSV